MKKFVLCMLFCTIICPVFALDGYDYQEGSYMDIDSEHPQRGDVVDVYDYQEGEFDTMDVENTYGHDDEIREVELYNPSEDEHHDVYVD